MDERCPVCLTDTKPTARPGSRVGYRRCPACGLEFNPLHFKAAIATRARLIAEAVKPWREALETLVDAKRERCMEICQPADADFDCCVICTNRPCLTARALIFNSESVKTNEETT